MIEQIEALRRAVDNLKHVAAHLRTPLDTSELDAALAALAAKRK